MIRKIFITVIIALAISDFIEYCPLVDEQLRALAMMLYITAIACVWSL